MSKNEEEERKNPKAQRRDNKLTKVNRKRENDDKRPLSEGGKPDDISKTFPNFSALTNNERLAFFQALITARKNVEKRGVSTRQCFGTIHDEYLKYFTQDEEEEKEVLENIEEISSPKPRSSLRNGNSSYSDKSTFKLNPRDCSNGKSRTPTPLPKNTSKIAPKGNKAVTSEPGPWDHCESVIQQNTNEMINLYLRKKKRNETKSSDVRPENKKSGKTTENRTPEIPKRRNAEAGRKKKDSSLTRTTAKTSSKVRNTPRFDALNSEERQIFFRTLQKAHDNIVEKNPKKEGEILPLNAIMKRYQGDRQGMAVFTTTQELHRKEGGRRNLRVKVTLTSGDNERLSKTKSQVLSDAMREANDRRHKSVESLRGEGKERDGKDEIENRTDQSQSKSSFYNIEKESKSSIEINNETPTKLSRTEENTVAEREEEQEQNPERIKFRTKEKKKVKRKEKKLPSFGKLKTSELSSPPYEPKISDSLKINPSNLSFTPEKRKTIKAIEEEFLRKKHSKHKAHKKKNEQKLFKTENFFLWQKKGDDGEDVKESNDFTLINEQTKAEAGELGSTETIDTNENSVKEICETQKSFTIVNAPAEFCEETRLESEQNEETPEEVEKTEENVSDEEKQKAECLTAFGEGKIQVLREEKSETAMGFEGQEEKLSKTDSEPLRSVTAEEVTPPIPNPSIKEENVAPVNSSISNSDNDCEEKEKEMNKLSDSEQKKQESSAMEIQKEIIVEASALREVFKGGSFAEEKPRDEGEAEEKEKADFVPGKVMFVDDNVIEKIRKLIYYLEAKVQRDSHLENEYLQLLVDYVDYLSKVLESLVLKEEQHHKQMVHDMYAADVHLKFNDANTAEDKMSEKRQNKSKDFFPRSVSNQDLRRSYSESSITEIKANKPTERFSNEKSEEEVPIVMESGSSSDSETEARFLPINTGDKKILTTNIRLLQDLLHQRAEFVEGSIADFKIVHHPEAEDFIPVEKPPTVQVLTDEDEENKQQDNKMKFLKSLLKCCPWGKKKTDEEGIFENLKGEAVRVDVYEEKKNDPASATLNQSTMEVLKAAERKKIIEKYYNQD